MKMKEKNKKIGSYIIKMQECLGKGAFATTYKAYKDKNYNQPFACKVIQKQDIQKVLQSNLNYFIKRVQQQYKALQSLKHENIVSFLDVEETSNNLYLFFQYCESDLAKYIQTHLFHPNQQQIFQFSKQIISACCYYTSKGFIHRDIKPANILIKNKQIKIADFGLATQIIDADKSVTFAGTPQYMAPEILKGVKMKEVGLCDVWSVGITLYELATGQLPFGLSKKDLSEQKIMDQINKTLYISQNHLRIQNHPILQRLVNQMLIDDSNQRISFQKAFKLISNSQLQNKS